jgi:hypothetical protein
MICGTVVNSKFDGDKQDLRMKNNAVFARKLRMMRADLFTCLSISQSGMFFKKKEDTTALKKSILKYFD